jgi:hypothetical protein
VVRYLLAKVVIPGALINFGINLVAGHALLPDTPTLAL